MLDEAQGSLSGFDFHVSPASESFYDWMYAAHSRLAAAPPERAGLCAAGGDRASESASAGTLAGPPF